MKLEECHLRTHLSARFTTVHGIVKFISMLLLTLSEYLYLTSPICLNESVLLATLYPYAAFVGTVMLALTYIAYMSGIPNCEVSAWIMVELVLSFLLLTGMIWVCNMTLHYCERPVDLFYIVPETLGLVVSLVQLVHSLMWLYRYRYQSSSGQIKIQIYE